MTIFREKDEKFVQSLYIHVSCYIMRPECTYNLATESVDGFHYIDRTRKNTNNCAICGNMVGITVPCNNENCRRSFHP